MRPVVVALVIAGTNLRRTARYRSNLFFMVLFPMLLILIIGAAFGGGFTPAIGVVVGEPGPLADRLVTALAGTEDLRVEVVSGEDALRRSVERGEFAAGLVVPAGYDTALAAGDQAELRYLARPDESGQQLGLAVRAVVAEQAAVLRAARFAAGEADVSFEDGVAAADEAAPRVAPLGVRTTTVGDALFPENLGRFDLGASSQLLLFVFLTSLTSAAALIESRRLGVSRRMLATPTGAGTILAGEALGRTAVALVQGLIIMLGASLLFGVDWGHPAGAAAVLLLFALVGGGAAMVVGAAFRNDQQAAGIGVMLGLGLAALGGSMAPIEVFSGTLRTIAFFTPHAWANDAFAELVRRGGGPLDIVPQLGVLAGYALGLFLVGGWLFRRTLTR